MGESVVKRKEGGDFPSTDLEGLFWEKLIDIREKGRGRGHEKNQWKKIREYKNQWRFSHRKEVFPGHEKDQWKKI